MATLPKKYINAHTNFFQSFMRIIGLSAAIVTVGFGIWLLGVWWFVVRTEVDPTFPSEPQGLFTRTPSIITQPDGMTAEWSIPTVCQSGRVEIHKEDDDVGSWFVAEAQCVGQSGSSFCTVDLSDQDLSKNVKYHLQAHSYQCSNDEGYVSEVITLSL